MRKLMVVFMFVILALTLGSQRASAQVPACDTDTLADYIADGSCTIGDKTFTFTSTSYSTTGGAPAASAITVIPHNPGGGVEGLTFQGSWVLSGTNASMDSLISFTVANSTGAATIEDASFITLSGVGITGDGQLVINEGLCLGGFPCPGGGKALFAAGTTSGTFFLTDHTTFTPTGAVDASKDINLSVGANGGLVSMTSITDDFSQVVPEPGSLLLLGTGLLSFGGLLRRRMLGA